MGLALIGMSEPQLSLGNLNEYNLFGTASYTSTELATQASCTEDATFSKLAANIIAGNSGTATFRFRDAGANGSETFQITGTGANEDASNTDSLTAGDLFNVAYTDTGTNSTCAWQKCNVSFSSGHGAFHGSAHYGGRVYDVASSTRFIGLAGIQEIDGAASEDNVAFKARGYDTFEALQVRVQANARTNDSIFRNRINKANGSAVITFGTGVTGLLTATGLADAISDGQVIGASITLDTGVEDLTVNFTCATLKSAASKQDTWLGNTVGLARAASTTANYWPVVGAISDVLTGLTEANARIKAGFAGTASNLRCYLSANTYASDATLKLYQNGSAVLTTTLTASGGAGWYENTTDTVSFASTDELSFELDEGGASGSATVRMIGVTFAPAAAAAGSILIHPGMEARMNRPLMLGGLNG